MGGLLPSSREPIQHPTVGYSTSLALCSCRLSPSQSSAAKKAPWYLSLLAFCVHVGRRRNLPVSPEQGSSCGDCKGCVYPRPPTFRQGLAQTPGTPQALLLGPSGLGVLWLSPASPQQAASWM